MQAELITGKNFIMKKYSKRIKRTKSKGIFVAGSVHDYMIALIEQNNGPNNIILKRKLISRMFLSLKYYLTLKYI